MSYYRRPRRDREREQAVETIQLTDEVVLVSIMAAIMSVSGESSLKENVQDAKEILREAYYATKDTVGR